jgi:hypothetical protein
MTTMTTLRLFRLLAPAVALFLATVRPAAACAACYGDTTGSKMGTAADIGIIVMVVIMLFMLAAIGGFIWYLNYRAKNPLPDYDELLREDADPDTAAHPVPGAIQPNAL